MKWLLTIVGVLVALALVVVVVGLLLPKEHTVTRAIRLRQPPAAVWQAVTDYKQFPQWRPEVQSVEPLPASLGKDGWVETVKGAGRIPLAVTDSVPERLLVMHIADPNLPFGGDWTYDLIPAPDGSATELRITEKGTVSNPFFRFVSRFILGQRATMDNYLKELGAKFGENVRLEN